MLELGSWESAGATMAFASTSTVTMFQGVAPVELLRERVREITLAHPWLAGRLKTEDGRVTLRPAPTETAHFEVVDGHVLAPTMSYEAILQQVRPHLVPPGAACVDEDEPLFRVVVFAQASAFAVLVSLSHVLGDGSTFYQIYGLLSMDAVSPAAHAVDASSARLPEFPDFCQGAFGAAKERWLSTPEVYASMQRAWEEPMRFDVHHLNGAWLDEQKRSHMERDAAAAPYVSTNDVLTSWFFGLGGFFGYGIMAINCRGRQPGLTYAHLGNYETFVHYFPDEAATPAGVRTALLHPPKFAAGRADVPTAVESRSLHWACATNWSTFYQHVALPGCAQLVHLPLYDVDVFMPGGMVIFRPNEGRLALLSMVRSDAHQACLKESGALGAAVLGGSHLL